MKHYGLYDAAGNKLDAWDSEEELYLIEHSKPKPLSPLTSTICGYRFVGPTWASTTALQAW